jgi:hypothetical protein
MVPAAVDQRGDHDQHEKDREELERPEEPPLEAHHDDVHADMPALALAIGQPEEGEEDHELLVQST